MAPRKNTQSAEDSLKGAQPEQAEAEQAAAPETGQQQTGGGESEPSETVAGPPADRRIATAIDTILLDGAEFGPGEPIPVTATDFAALAKCGVVAEAAWDDLDPVSDTEDA